MTDPALTRPASVVSARPPLIDDLTTCEEGARIIVHECLAHIGANIAPTLETRAPEALHQVRVGLRRLRVALENFSNDDPAFSSLIARGRELTNGLGAARDLDVFLDELFEPAAQRLGSQTGFEMLRARAAILRKRAWHGVIAELSSASFAKFQDDVAAAVEALSWRGASPLVEAAPELLEGHLAKAKKRGRHLAQKSAPERHRLRIALKKLRYTAEFFAPLYREKKVDAFIEPLKELQDLLGHLNDAAQARAVLGRLMMEEATTAREQTDLSFAAGLIQGFYSARAEFVTEKTLKRWKRFKRAEPFWI